MKYDFEAGGEKEVETILKNAKKSDVVTLINLLPRVDDLNKTRVYTVITNYSASPKNIPGDSVPRLNTKELNEWIQEFQEEWQKEMKENMNRLKEDLKKMNKELRENLSKIPQGEYNFDDEHFNEDLQQKIQENLEQHLGKLENLNELIVIPDELIEKTIEESLEKTNKDLERNSERIDREMERLQERLEKMNESIQDDIEKQMEREEELKEKQKEHEEQWKEKEEKYKKKYKGYWKDKEFHFEEVPEGNEVPVTPEKDGNTPEEIKPEKQPETETPENKEEKEFNYQENGKNKNNQHNALTNSGRIYIILPLHD